MSLREWLFRRPKGSLSMRLLPRHNLTHLHQDIVSGFLRSLFSGSKAPVSHVHTINQRRQALVKLHDHELKGLGRQAGDLQEVVAVTAAVRREIAAMDPQVTAFNARSMTEQIAEFMAPLRTASWTYGLTGVFRLGLASVGLAGVTAYSVARRGHEIGIRMALGARSADVLGLVRKEGVALVTASTIVGMMGAWAGSRMLATMNSTVGTVTSTSTSDPLVLVGAPLLVASVALVACYVPARKSLHIDPAVALRQE